MNEIPIAYDSESWTDLLCMHVAQIEAKSHLSTRLNESTLECALPDELWQCVFSFLSWRPVLNLRLASTCADNARMLPEPVSITSLTTRDPLCEVFAHFKNVARFSTLTRLRL